MNDKKIIFVIGPPGAGKDTQVNRLAEKTGFYKFITGDEGLDYISKHMKDPLTAKQKENYDNGRVYDPEWLIEHVQRGKTAELLEGGYNGIIFSGSPRTLYEAENLPKILSKITGEENIITVVIEVEEEELRRRAKDRLVCSNDKNHTFSIRLDEFKLGDKCPEGDGFLERKNLDEEIDTRLQQYKDRTKQGIEYMKENGKIVFVDGNPAPDEVEKNINEALEKEKFL